MSGSLYSQLFEHHGGWHGWPCTILPERYGDGWLALPCDAECVPREVHGGDMDCWLYFDRNPDSRCIGRGATPDAALADLRRIAAGPPPEGPPPSADD